MTRAFRILRRAVEALWHQGSYLVNETFTAMIGPMFLIDRCSGVLTGGSSLVYILYLANRGPPNGDCTGET